MKDISIAVNVRHLIPDKMEGIGWFSYQTMLRITQQHPEIHFYFLLDRNFSDEFIFADNITPVILSPPARHPLLIYYWNEWLVPNLLTQIKPDIYLSLDGFISKRAKYKQYAIVHDLNFLAYPQYLTWSIKKLYDYFFVKQIHLADRIGTVSEFSKSEIIKYFNFPSEKIDIIYNASNLKIRAIKPEEEKSIKEKYTNHENYFLYVSSIHPRKNVIGIIKAFDKYKKKTHSRDKLVIAGRFFWNKKDVMNVVQDCPFREDIVFTGRLADDTVLILMKFAKAFVYVSYYEGFGVPIIEAMQMGTPVITANTSSLNEIAGDAALKVHPENIDAIADAMQLISSNKNIAEQLINKAYVQSQKFNWDTSAELLWQGISKLIFSSN